MNRFRVKTKTIFTFFVVAGFFFMIGFFKTHHLPKIKSWVLVEIEKTTSKHSPIRIWPESLEFTIFPVGVKFQGVRILPKEKIAPFLAPTTIDEVSASLSFLSALQGKLRIAELTVNNFELKTFVRKSNKTKATPPEVSLNWEFLYDLPINDFIVINMDFYLRDYNTGVSAFLKDVNININNEYKAITVDFSSPTINLKKTGEAPILDVSIDTKFLVEENGVYFSGFKLRRGQSFVVAAGAINGDSSKLDFNRLNLKTRSHLKLQELRLLAQKLLPETTVPTLNGKAEIDLEISGQRGEHPNFEFNLRTDDAKVQGFEVGDVEAQGNYLNKEAKLSKFNLSHSGGQINVDDFKLSVGQKTRFSTILDVENIDLNRLLAGLKVQNVPVYTSIDGRFPCNGQITPKFRIRCNGETDVKHLKVLGADRADAFPIVAFKDGKVKGRVQIDDKAVKYNAQVSIGESTGLTTGTISYEKGFNIEYQAKEFHLDDLENLANLDMQGQLRLIGNTKGTSRHATVSMTVNSDDFWLKQYGLGQVQMQFLYENGILNFRNIQGQQNTTRYKGNVSVNLRHDEIFIEFDAPFIDLQEVRPLFAKKIDIPFSVSGTGSVRANISGPLEVSRLSYDVKTSIYRGTIAGESFDQINLHVESEKGHVKTRKAVITKAQSRVEMSGELKPSGELSAFVSAKNLRIEQSENLSRLKLKVFGQLDFTIETKGQMSDLTTNVKGELKKLVIGDEPAEDSRFELSFNNRRAEGKANLFGEVIQTRFIIPYRRGSPLSLNFETNKWDFTKAFGIFSGNPTQAAFETRLTSELKLTSETGDLMDGMGQFKVDDFEIRRGPIFMANRDAIMLSYYKGSFQTKDFSIHGPGTFLELKTPKASPGKLNLELTGKLDLSLTSLITPFLDDIRGDLSVSINTEGTLNDPQALGSAYIQNGVMRIQNFPHAISDLSADLLFSRQSILLNSLKGEIGNGQLKAGGSIQFESFDKIPVSVNGEIKDAKLDVPKGFSTQGSGQFKISGDWFPYKLSAQYNIFDGRITREVGTGQKSEREIQPSSFLPDFLLKDTFRPIEMDAEINIRNEIPVQMKIGGVDINTPISGQLSILGQPSAPLLKGRMVTGTDGRVTFRSNVFEIRTGQIEYAMNKPNNPSLLVSADTRVDEYDINLVVQGSARDPEINLTSQPPLEEHKLVSLLALGVVSGDPTAAATDTYEVSSGIIADQLGLGEELRSRLGVEVDITSTISVGDDADANETEHKVTVKKQWSPRFGMSASRSFGSRNKNDVKVEYKLNKGLSVVGNYSQTEAEEASAETENEVGLNLEYKLEFK